MKKTISLSAIILITAMTVLSNLHVQAAAVLHDKTNTGGIPSSSLVVTEESDVSAKTLKSFNKDFKVNVPVRWYSNENYDFAYFIEGGIQYRICYNKNGKKFRTLKSYSVELLDNRLRQDIEQTWDGYEITGVWEVIEGNMHAYFINIASNRKIKQLVVYNQEITVRRQFDKQ